MEHHVFSPKFPPKNRKDLGLDVLQVQLEDADGVVNLDPNGVAMLGYTRKVPVSKPKFPSFLSGEPGYMYRTFDGVEFAVTHDELLRLCRMELRPEELKKLHAHFGAFYETHDDFYDEDSGIALQPMSER